MVVDDTESVITNRRTHDRELGKHRIQFRISRTLRHSDICCMFELSAGDVPIRTSDLSTTQAEESATHVISTSDSLQVSPQGIHLWGRMIYCMGMNSSHVIVSRRLNGRGTFFVLNMTDDIRIPFASKILYMYILNDFRMKMCNRCRTA